MANKSVVRNTQCRRGGLGVRQRHNELDEDDIEIMFASEETLANCDVFTNLSADILELYDTLWSELKK